MTAPACIETNLPAHLAALQLLVNRCEHPSDKKSLIVAAGISAAITLEEGCLMVTANQLETA